MWGYLAVLKYVYPHVIAFNFIIIINIISIIIIIDVLISVLIS